MEGVVVEGVVVLMAATVVMMMVVVAVMGFWMLASRFFAGAAPVFLFER